MIGETYIGDRLEEICQVALHLLLIGQLDELAEVILNEVRIDQILVRLDFEDTRLVFNRKAGCIDGCQLCQKYVVLEELGPLVG